MTPPSDERLVQRVAAGDERAFEQLYDRYCARLLSFCRYLLGSRDEAQDAVQQTFMRAHRAIASGKAPSELRPWLYTVARNRCRSLLAARRERELPVEELGDAAALDGLADVVQRREDLRALVRDLDRLPEDQRSALVLFELGDLSQRDIGDVLGVAEPKVKALVHQARTHLILERAARERSCDDVRAELAVARGAALRRGPLRRHVRSCPACRAWQAEVGRQRAALGAVLPVALIGSREAALTALGVGASGAGAAAGFTGAAGGAGGFVAAVAKTGVATKVVAAIAALGVGAAGTEVAVHSIGDATPKRTAPRVAPAAAGAAAAPTRVPVSAPASAAATAASRGANRATAAHAAAAARKAAKRREQALRRAAREARKAARTTAKVAEKAAKDTAKSLKPVATKAKAPKLHPTPVKPIKKPAKKPAKAAPAATSETPVLDLPRGNADGHEK
jgi:RNA polymerase sigma factor (sigma-70 family)